MELDSQTIVAAAQKNQPHNGNLALSATTALQNRSTYPQGQENQLCTNFSGYLTEGLILSTYFLFPDLAETLCHVLRGNVAEIASPNLRKPLPGVS